MPATYTLLRLCEIARDCHLIKQGVPLTIPTPPPTNPHTLRPAVTVLWQGGDDYRLTITGVVQHAPATMIVAATPEHPDGRIASSNLLPCKNPAKTDYNNMVWQRNIYNDMRRLVSPFLEAINAAEQKRTAALLKQQQDEQQQRERNKRTWKAANAIDRYQQVAAMVAAGAKSVAAQNGQIVVVRPTPPPIQPGTALANLLTLRDCAGGTPTRRYRLEVGGDWAHLKIVWLGVAELAADFNRRDQWGVGPLIATNTSRQLLRWAGQQLGVQLVRE